MKKQHYKRCFCLRVLTNNALNYPVAHLAPLVGCSESQENFEPDILASQIFNYSSRIVVYIGFGL